MALLNDTVRKKTQAMLTGLKHEVKLVFFTQEIECAHCREARAVVEEVAGLSDKLSLEIHNLQIDSEVARQYNVDNVPAICVVGAEDRGIRFYGVPSGYEFTSLLAAIGLVGNGDSGLKAATRAKLKELKTPVDIQVFVTLSCPYCPLMVALAHRFAFESDKVTAAGVDAGEFPQLANLFQVMAVPRTVINRKVSREGALPESALLEAVLEAARSDAGTPGATSAE